MTRTRSRRDLLGAGAVALGGLAGCVGGGNGDSDTGTPTARGPSDGASPTVTTESPAVELVPTSVQSSFFYRTTRGSVDVGAATGRQFAFVAVRPRTDSPPPPSDFALVADGRHFWGSLAPGEVGGPYRLIERGRSYLHGDARPGWVAFEVPDPLDAERVHLVHDGRRRPVGDDFLAALRAPPADFELLDFAVPDRGVPDESLEVSVAVHNAGDGNGIFRACLDVVGSTRPPRRMALGVPPRERREWTRTLDAEVSAGEDDVRVRFTSAVADREVAVRNRSTTATGQSPNRLE